MKTKSKIWLGVGAFVVIGAGTTGGPLVAEPAPGASLLRAPTTDIAIPDTAMNVIGMNGITTIAIAMTITAMTASAISTWTFRFATCRAT